MHLAMFLVALISLSQSGNLVRIASAPVEVLGFWRLLGAFVLMAGFAKYKQKTLWPRKIPRRNLYFTLSSGFFLFVHLWTYFYACQNTSIANAMIIFAANPLFTALFSILFLKDKISVRLIIAYFLAVVGLYQLLSEKISLTELSGWGNWSALASAGLYSAYILLGKSARAKVSNVSYSWVVYLIVCICFFLTGLIKGISWAPYPMKTWGAILASIAFPTLLGHALFTYLLNHLNVNWMSCGKLLEPGMSALIAFFLFSEKPSFSTYMAFLFTGASVLVLFAPWGQSPSKTNTQVQPFDPLEK